ncbi:MAG: hypothetical protein R3F30_00770 [Planctomycetota bacterium]
MPGNHDYFHGRDLGYWRGFLEERGVRVLLNERAAGSSAAALACGWPATT